MTYVSLTVCEVCMDFVVNVWMVAVYTSVINLKYIHLFLSSVFFQDDEDSDDDPSDDEIDESVVSATK